MGKKIGNKNGGQKMELKQKDIACFKLGELENPRFWSRFSDRPILKGARIIDIGSGWGSLCVDMALAGAEKVVGLDLKSELVDFSNTYVQLNYPELKKVIEFKELHLKNYEGYEYDYIVSKDTFEHILDLDVMLCEMKKRLKLGGRIYAGFGPLYKSPYGDHDRRRTMFKAWGLLGRFLAYIPWGHLFLESFMICMHNRYRERKINSIRDTGLNKLALSDYQKIFSDSGMSILDFQTNISRSAASRIISLGKHVTVLEDFFTHNIYCILEKPAHNS